MIQRKAQTAEYWQTFTLQPEDVEFLHNLLLEAEEPKSTEDLALALVGERVRREAADIRADLSRGALYQPKNTYSPGDQLIFPALDFRVGQVIDSRPGQNPEHGDFLVITVDFGPDRRQREFAAALTAPHKLNADLNDLLVPDNSDTPGELLAGVASHLPERLAEELARHPQFAHFEDRWLQRDLLASIHVGHLNIAEALVEVRGQAVETGVLLQELDLPTEIKPDILAFSLQSALAADPRFDQVGAGETRSWYLRRFEPAAALETPTALRYEPVRYDRGALTVELLQLEWELDDEWSEETAIMQPASVVLPSTTLILTYPHLVSGTMPLASRTAPFFPTGSGERTMVTLIDGRWGQRFAGWVVPVGRYVAGLQAWYEQHKLPAGAYIVLERQENSEEILIDFRPKRMRRDWIRLAQVVDESRLDFQMRKQAISCEYDEQVVIGVDEPEEVVRLREDPAYANTPLSELVFQVFTDLAGLSQQGSVHAKTLYSAVNVVRRCPPGPIFAALAADSRMQSLGEGLYRLEEG